MTIDETKDKWNTRRCKRLKVKKKIPRDQNFFFEKRKKRFFRIKKDFPGVI
jgi:hypothetical protein